MERERQNQDKERAKKLRKGNLKMAFISRLLRRRKKETKAFPSIYTF